MGWISRWLKALFVCGRCVCSEKNAKAEEVQERWSVGRSTKGYQHVPHAAREGEDSAWMRSFRAAERDKEQSKHAIAVAAATAAAADAAVAAAHAAVAAVRLTTSHRTCASGQEWVAALIIQSAFRRHLAKKALRALKALVKIQALVRGYLVRRQTAVAFQSMQALMRAQATVKSIRSPDYVCRTRSLPRQSYGRRPYEKTMRPIIFESYEIEVNSFEESPKVIRMEGSPSPKLVPGRVSIPKSRHLHDHGDPRKSTTTHNTPRYTSSVCSTSTGGGSKQSVEVPNYPNYMVRTQSFSAKLRSQSAPKQRPESSLGLRKRSFTDEAVDSRASFSALGSFRSVVVGRLDRSLDLLTGSKEYYHL